MSQSFTHFFVGFTHFFLSAAAAATRHRARATPEQIRHDVIPVVEACELLLENVGDCGAHIAAAGLRLEAM